MSVDLFNLSVQLSSAFKLACLAELEALKPGNVHIFADGHGMVVQDFIKSAEASAAVIAQPQLSVGERIFQSIAATWAAVECNTNLGIVLLSAPLIQAALHGHKPTLRERVQDVLTGLTVTDAELTYQAIIQASPAGLGQSERHDVRMPPTVTLLEAMREASQRDRIALQYVNGFVDVFDFGVRRYEEALQRWPRPAWAATAVYMGFLASFNDSHILRKYGESIAMQVREEARVHEQALLALENPKTYQRNLLNFDADLKSRGLNPGTCADLTVASLFVVAIEKIIANNSWA
ncbi:MAG TPA: triphosphoribosyl-dephospho-CoA synthase [Methylophilaceae bacterium]|nr:triphosphoribosyl-dephospho-CoA synthase [Methylophilaceae bacterium]